MSSLTKNCFQKCITIAWQAFGILGAIGLAPVRGFQKYPSCLTEPMPAHYKMDPPLGKAKPIINGSNASIITHLRRKKKIIAQKYLWPEK